MIIWMFCLICIAEDSNRKCHHIPHHLPVVVEDWCHTLNLSYIPVNLVSHIPKYVVLLVPICSIILPVPALSGNRDTWPIMFLIKKLWPIMWCPCHLFVWLVYNQFTCENAYLKVIHNSIFHLHLNCIRVEFILLLLFVYSRWEVSSCD